MCAGFDITENIYPARLSVEETWRGRGGVIKTCGVDNDIPRNLKSTWGEKYHQTKTRWAYFPCSCQWWYPLQYHQTQAMSTKLPALPHSHFPNPSYVNKVTCPTSLTFFATTFDYAPATFTDSFFDILFHTDSQFFYSWFCAWIMHFDWVRIWEYSHCYNIDRALVVYAWRQLFLTKHVA